MSLDCTALVVRLDVHCPEGTYYSLATFKLQRTATFDKLKALQGSPVGVIHIGFVNITDTLDKDIYGDDRYEELALKERGYLQTDDYGNKLKLNSATDCRGASEGGPGLNTAIFSFIEKHYGSNHKICLVWG